MSSPVVLTNCPGQPGAQELGELQSPVLESLARKERKQISGVHELVFSSTSGEFQAGLMPQPLVLPGASRKAGARRSHDTPFFACFRRR